MNEMESLIFGATQKSHPPGNGYAWHSASQMILRRRINGFIAIVLLVIGVLLAVDAGQASPEDGTQTLDVAGWTNINSGIGDFLYRPLRGYPNFQVGFVSMMFLVLGALYHGGMCYFVTEYEHELTEQRNLYRWMELALAMPLINCLIAVHCGQLDVYVLFAIFIMTFAWMTFGWLLESADLPAVLRMRVFLMSLGPFLSLWALILWSFGSALHESTTHPPGLIYAIAFCIMPLQALVCYNQIRPVFNFIEREYVYLVLIPVMKLLLAGLVHGAP